jgi:hypothetical protein
MTTLAAAAAASPNFSFRPTGEVKDEYHHLQPRLPLQQQQHHQQQQQAAQLYQSHLSALEAQSQRHTHQQQQEANPNLSPRQMLAAQQHFGFAIQQQQQQRDASQPVSGTTPSGGWNDDSELFLRNLLASNNNSPPSSISGGSYMATPSPSYVNGASSADEHLSPVSSSGFQSLHDFIHNNGIPTPPKSDTAAYTSMPGSEAMGSKSPPSMIMQPLQQQQQQMMYPGQDQQMDSNALEYFVNTMMHGNERPTMSGGGGLDPSLVSTMGYDYMGDSGLGFQQQSFAQQSIPPQQYQQMLQQQFMQSQQIPQQHPALEGRKRSAPSAMSGDANNAPSAAAKQPRVTKKVRRQSSNGQQAMPSMPVPALATSKDPMPTLGYQPMTSFMPRMEVGSNATALAAIERLKAKRRAEMEQRIKQEEAMASQPKKEGRVNGRGSDGSYSSGEPMQKNQKKVAHNAIERRYRNNINDRITALRNAVPALRELRPKKAGGSRKGKNAQEQDLVDGVPAATKLNKATILGKATEYIRYLKGRETRLVSEVAGLRELIRSLEGGEELLDLWEGEMEKVVAEQEAKAKEAFALEDDSFDFGGSDDEEDEEDDFDVKPSSRSSSGSSSSRYMMGVFMGFSVLGGGAELMSEHMAASTASESAQTVVRASSGRVFGASHQLLKRGMAATNVKLGSVAELPHHFDHVPSHVLAVEVMRGIALLACLVFIFWPLVGRFITGTSKKANRKNTDGSTVMQRRKEMLDALARSRPRPHEMDVSMRKFVGAPGNAVNSGIALVKFIGLDLAYRLRLLKRDVMNAERAAVWCRLLELETSLGPLAHRSLLARLHTILTVATLPNVGSSVQSEDVTVLNPARVYATMAIAIVRAARKNYLAMLFAERIWTNARRCRLTAIEQEDEDTSRDVQDRWIDGILEHPLSDAIALCPSPTAVAMTFSTKVDSNTRASLLSPLLSIAAIQQGHQLTQIWSSLLGQIVQSTCPPSQKDAIPTVSEFMKHHSDVKIFLSSVATQSDQDRISAQISRLSLTAPKCENWQTISNVTFGTWALLIGNISVARSVAAALISSFEGIELPMCAVSFIKLVFDGNDALLAVIPKGALEPVNEVDALAAATLNWLQFLRLVAASAKGQSKGNDLIAEKALHIRRLLASARMARSTIEEAMLLISTTDLTTTGSSHRDSLSSNFSSTTSSSPSTPSEDTQGQMQGHQGAHLDDTLDTLTDILALLGSKAALGTLHDWKRHEQDAEHQHDSGVEWGV